MKGYIHKLFKDIDSVIVVKKKTARRFLSRNGWKLAKIKLEISDFSVGIQGAYLRFEEICKSRNKGVV